LLDCLEQDLNNMSRTNRRASVDLLDGGDAVHLLCSLWKHCTYIDFFLVYIGDIELRESRRLLYEHLDDK